MLLFIDGEEAIDGPWNPNNSLSGSRYFVNNYDLTFIERVYIFDLIGADFTKNKIAAFSSNPVTFYDMEKLSEINEKYDNQIFINPSKFTSDKRISDDHVPFVEKNKYALNLIPFNFPENHHTLNDNYKNVNWKYVEKFYKVFFEFLETIDY
jgi:Zn-dependent M28 family amino/carboxypeptidase